MSTDGIRPVVIGIPRRDDEIFVSRLYDPGEDERFYRPIGGGIEFGEYSTETLIREFDEELDIAVEVGDYLGVIENLFEFVDTPSHEVVLVYEIEQTDELWKVAQLEGYDDGGTSFTAKWMPLDDFEQGTVPLYPEGLLSLLRDDTAHVISEMEAPDR